jgi:hypothetical protein
MAKDIKFSDDELKQISDIRTAYAEITNRFGQIQLTKYNLQKQEEQAEIDFESVKVREQEVLKGITEKYGPGTLDPNTGVFTPSES